MNPVMEAGGIKKIRGKHRGGGNCRLMLINELQPAKDKIHAGGSRSFGFYSANRSRVLQCLLDELGFLVDTAHLDVGDLDMQGGAENVKH